MNFNVNPYNDDFSEDKNFYKVLYKPGYELQARELNTMQSILQNQVSSIGNHIFKNGSKISGCSTSFIQYDYARVNDTYNGLPVTLTPYNNKKIKLVGDVSKVEATIIDVTDKSDDDSGCLILIYTKTGIDKKQSTFIPGEDVVFYDENNVEVNRVTVKCPSCPSTSEKADNIPPVGKSLLFNIEEGVFFYNGYFTQIDGHHIIVEKYLSKDEFGNIVSDIAYRIGLNVYESIVTAETDSSLYDPHLGYPNEAAPGADRYKVVLTLEMRTYTENPDEPSNYIVLAKVRQNNNIEYKKDDTEYGDIMKEISRRTYEASGNFTLTPWKAHFLNEKKKDKADSLGWSVNGSDGNVVALLQPGLGYVKGYRVNTNSESIVVGRKARDTKQLRGGGAAIYDRANIVVNSTSNISWINHAGSSVLTDQTFNFVDLLGTNIGSFKAYDIYKLGATSYQLYIYDITMLSNKTLSMVKGVRLTDGSLVSTTDINFKLNGANNTNLLFPIGYKNIKTLRDNDNNKNGNTVIHVRKRLRGILDSNGAITFNASTNELFLAPTSQNSICWVNSNPTGTNVVITGANSSYTGTTLTLSLGSSNANKNISYVATTVMASQQEKTKTLTKHVYTTNNKPDGYINASTILTYADGFRLESVRRISISDSSVNDDLTSEYSFVNGQTDNFYTQASIVRNRLRTFAVDDRLIITYYYFEHSGSAGFFTVDSYSQLITDSSLNYTYSDIPKYIDKNKNEYKLAEYIDFRSIKTTNNVNINAVIPAFGSPVSFDIEYYLPRADLLLVNSDGKFYFKEGVSSDNPVLPSIDEDAMGIYEVYFSAYVYTLDDIKVKFIDNKRYTMKDISKLETRIGNIEYSVALNLLEQQTLNMSIKDTNGLDRYKNGFLVDNFKGYYGVDLNNKEFNASIDRTNGFLRPQFKQRNTRLSLDIAACTNIRRSGNVLTANYEEDLFISNVYATQALSINPYMVFRSTGTMVVSPNIDTWSDDKYLPSIVSNIDAGVDALRQVADAAKITGIDYGTWVDYNKSILVSSSVDTVTLDSATRKTVENVLTKQITTKSNRNVTSTSIGSKTQAYTIDDMVKDVSIIPYVRPNTIQFHATSMKPNTQLYAYFDGQAVSQHCKSTTAANTLASTIFGASPLLTDNDGNISGEFRIPANTFFTGEKKLVLTNDINNSGNPDVETTRSEAVYFAGGVSQTKQSSTLNIVTPTFVRNTSIENKNSTSVSRDVTVTNTFKQVVIPVVAAPAARPVATRFLRFSSGSGWLFSPMGSAWSSDPIAQGFNSTESCFISKVGLYFANVDINADVIWFEIREMINGYPAKDAISRKEMQASKLLPYVSADASIEYQVEFSAPIYIDASKSYAFVVGGYSPDTKVYISKLGDKIIGTNLTLEQPPLTYTMFRSLNGETWNAEQFTTMKFNLYRCIFDTSDSVVQFFGTYDMTVDCDIDPIEVEQGSNQVRIYAKDHGLRVGDHTILDMSRNNYYDIILTSGIPQIGQSITTNNGSVGIISDIRPKSGALTYQIAISNLEGHILAGQTFTCAAKNYEFRDVTSMQYVGSNSDQITYAECTGSIPSIVNDGLSSTIAGISMTEFAKSHVVTYVDSIDSFIITINSVFNTSGRFGGAGIVLYGANIKYDTFNISGQYLPYNTGENWQVTPYKHDYNEASKTISVVPFLDTYLQEPCIITNTSKETSVGSKSFIVSATMKLRTPYVSPVFNTDSFSVTTISNRIESITQESVNVSPNALGRYKEETDPVNGSQKFKHISTKVLLENPATDMRVIFDVLYSNTSDFDVYVKVSSNANADDDLVNWIKIDKYIKKSSNNIDFMEYDLQLSKNCNSWSSDNEYISYRVKLVGKSSDSTKPVIFQNLRAIALT